MLCPSETEEIVSAADESLKLIVTTSKSPAVVVSEVGEHVLEPEQPAFVLCHTIALFELTVTVTALEVTVELALSVTCSSKYHVPPVDKVPVEVVGSPEVVQPVVNELPRLL